MSQSGNKLFQKLVHKWTLDTRGHLTNVNETFKIDACVLFFVPTVTRKSSQRYYVLLTLLQSTISPFYYLFIETLKSVDLLL